LLNLLKKKKKWVIPLEIFDTEALNYDEWYKSKKGSFIDKIETDCAFGLFKTKEGMKVLDVGCGTGNFSLKLAKRGCKVVGIDVSNAMLEIAKKKAEMENLNIKFLKMDAHNLDFEDESFDGVFSIATVEFIEDFQKAIDEMFRVVKKGGQILIGTINKDSKWGRFYKSRSFSNSVFKYATFKGIEDLRNVHSNELVKIKECLFIPPNLDDEQFNSQNEERYFKAEMGGFICALWVKM